MDLSREYKDNLQKLQQAWHRFEYCEKDYIDLAILEIRVAEMKVDQTKKKLVFNKSLKYDTIVVW
jgi:hypothetical protein